jgi:hypothetical protein
VIGLLIFFIFNYEGEVVPPDSLDLESWEYFVENPINPNFAPIEDLRKLPLLSEEEVFLILREREKRFFKNFRDFTDRIGLDNISRRWLSNLLTFKSSKHKFRFTLYSHISSQRNSGFRFYAKGDRVNLLLKSKGRNPFLMVRLRDIWLDELTLGNFVPLGGLGLLLKRGELYRSGDWKNRYSSTVPGSPGKGGIYLRKGGISGFVMVGENTTSGIRIERRGKLFSALQMVFDTTYHLGIDFVYYSGWYSLSGETVFDRKGIRIGFLTSAKVYSLSFGGGLKGSQGDKSAKISIRKELSKDMTISIEEELGIGSSGFGLSKKRRFNFLYRNKEIEANLRFQEGNRDGNSSVKFESNLRVRLGGKKSIRFFLKMEREKGGEGSGVDFILNNLVFRFFLFTVKDGSKLFIYEPGCPYTNRYKSFSGSGKRYIIFGTKNWKNFKFYGKLAFTDSYPLFEMDLGVKFRKFIK